MFRETLQICRFSRLAASLGPSDQAVSNLSHRDCIRILSHETLQFPQRVGLMPTGISGDDRVGGRVDTDMELLLPSVRDVHD